MIIPKHAKIGDLYKTNAILSVPKYQRGFDWGKSEVFEMIMDIIAAKETKASLFLGTFVFDVSDKAELKIVDGQQRITSLTLLLVACRQHAKALGYHSLAHEIQKKISFTDETTGEMSSERVFVSSSIADVFKYIADESWDGEFPVKIGSKYVKRQSTKLKGLYHFMLETIESFEKKELSDFMGAIYSSYVIQIEIQDELEAFDIFERTNARGLSLNVADLLKNYLYANYNEGENIDKAWKDITNNAGSTLQRMLKYYWVSKNGYVNKRDLYRKLKQSGQREGVDTLATGISDFSFYYAAIQSDDEQKIKEWLNMESCETLASNKGHLEIVASSFIGLNHFKITQHFPLIYSIVNAYKRSNQGEQETKLLLRLVRDIESYHFVNNQICDRVGNEIEKPYADFSKRFSETDEFVSVCNELILLLKEKLATEEEFESRFTELDYQTLSLADSCYIFDRINNYDLKPSEWLKIYDPDKTILQNHYNTEHFLSQKPDFDVSDDDMEVVDNIGNLFIIARHTNSQLQNHSPAEKIKLLDDKGKKFRYICNFVKEFNNSDMKWGKEEILKRANDLAKLSYKHVWRIN